MTDSRPASPPWKPLEISLLIGSVMLITLAAFEGLATTTIMPNVVEDLDAEQWFSVASGSSMAAQLAATVIAGALADSRGPAKVLLVGLSFFTVGLLVSGFAPQIWIFVVGRLIQGIGGGLIIVPLYVFIGSVAPPEHRPSFFAAFSLAWVLPSLIGPAIAGYAATHVGWRPVFWAVPLLAAIATLPLVSVLRRLAADRARQPTQLSRLAILALVCGSGVLLLQLAGALGQWRLIALTLAGLVLTGWALPRLMPKGAFTLRRGVPSAIMTRLFAMGAQAGASAFIPLVLQRVHHWHADSASLAVTVGTVSWAFGATLQSRVRDGNARMRLPVIGVILLTAGLIPVVGLVNGDWPVWPALVGWFCCGAGTGMMHSTLSVLTLGLSRPEEHGKVSSWLQVADSAGSAVELAVVSIALSAWTFIGVTGDLSYAPAPLIALLVSVLSIISAMRIADAASS